MTAGIRVPGPTMPVPRALESLAGVAHHPDRDVPEVSIRNVVAAITVAMGGQIHEYLAQAATREYRTAGIVEHLDAAVAALDVLLDAVDEAWTPRVEPTGEP